MKEEREGVADFIVGKISGGYHKRDDYPPFKMMAWEDRSVFLEYIKRVLKDLEDAKEIRRV